MWKRTLLALAGCGLAALLLLAVTPGPAQPPADKKTPTDPPPVKPADQVISATSKGEKPATSRVAAVTVYTNGARVTREVEVPEGDGTFELTVAPLPPATVNSSLYTEGTEFIRVLATRFRSRPILEDTRAEVRKLQGELAQLRQSEEKLESDLRAVDARLKHFDKLEAYTGVTTVQLTEKSALNSESVIALSKYINEGRAETFKEQTGLKQQVQAIQGKAEFARRQLGELAATPSRTERDAVLVVQKTKNAAGKVRLHYLVDDASWRPQYKFQAGKAARDTVKVEYLAAVMQQTGEDWSNVHLVLSTAQQTLNSAPPDLQALQVTVVPQGQNVAAPPTGAELEDRVQSLWTKALRDFNQKKQSLGAGLVNTAAALDQSFELLNPDEACRRGCLLAVREGPSVTYHLPAPMTIPSRPDEQMLEMARIDLQPDYYYKAVPILTQHVYRLADLTNKSNHVLLPGDATMYVDSDFVGQMTLPLVAVGEQFTVGFGVDPQLQVQRQMTDKGRTTQGGNQVLRYQYRISVNSYKQDRVRLQVWDRLPHAESDTVGVSLLTSKPEISKDAQYMREQRPTNLLRWDVDVEPNTSGEKALAINYEFRLELDRKMTISNFQNSRGPLVEASAGPALPPLTAEEAAKIKAALAKLTPEDRALAEAQTLCVIDNESRLGSNGPPIKMIINGKPVFTCCKGCAAEAKAHPEDVLVRFEKLMDKVKVSTLRK
jgi:uncharacterized protein (TIGR02231 family)